MGEFSLPIGRKSVVNPGIPKRISLENSGFFTPRVSSWEKLKHKIIARQLPFISHLYCGWQTFVNIILLQTPEMVKQ